jgi:hypothetical protein
MTADRKTKNLLGGVVGAILILALCFAPAAMAAGEFEPNDDFDVAYGPLAAGTTYSATLENGDDLDTYYFFVAGQGGTPVEITIADTSPGGTGLYAELDDTDGEPIDQLDILAGDFDAFEEVLEPGTYYLMLQTEAYEQVDETYEIRTKGGTGAFRSQAEVRAQCRTATEATSKAKAALEKAKRKLKLARKSGSRQRKTAAQRTVKAARARLRAANADAALLCAVAS